jgi:SPP1 gp7 family putative phage head morphogenesis protein
MTFLAVRKHAARYGWPQIRNQSTIRGLQDPSRTAGISRSYIADLKRRWQRIEKLIWETVVVNDALQLDRLQQPTAAATAGTAFEFSTNPRGTQAAFQEWLNNAIDDEVLEVVRGPTGQILRSSDWQNTYVRAAYGRGVEFADAAAERAGIPVADVPLSEVFRAPVHTRTLQNLYARNFSELQGISSTASQRIARALTEGVATGQSPRTIALEMRRQVSTIGRTRSNTMARTEVINAHAEATLNRYSDAGLKGVVGQAEFLTAGDDRVCTLCQDLEAQVFTLEAARGVIPVHANCRCVWLPVLDGAPPPVPATPPPPSVAPQKPKPIATPQPTPPPTTNPISQPDLPDGQAPFSAAERATVMRTIDDEGAFYFDDLDITDVDAARRLPKAEEIGELEAVTDVLKRSTGSIPEDINLNKIVVLDDTPLDDAVMRAIARNEVVPTPPVVFEEADGTLLLLSGNEQVAVNMMARRTRMSARVVRAEAADVVDDVDDLFELLGTPAAPTPVDVEDLVQVKGPISIAVEMEKYDWPADIAEELTRRRAREIGFADLSPAAQAITRYQNGAYEAINGYLRSGRDPNWRPASAGTNLDKAKRYIDDLDDAIKSMPQTEVDMMMYRGAMYDADLQVGDTFVDKGFVSVTSDSRVTADFLEGVNDGATGYLYRMQVPKGSRGIYMDEVTGREYGEREFLMARDYEWEVANIKVVRPGVAGRDFRDLDLLPDLDGFFESGGTVHVIDLIPKRPTP